jgi:hypothetical protein
MPHTLSSHTKKMADNANDGYLFRRSPLGRRGPKRGGHPDFWVEYYHVRDGCNWVIVEMLIAAHKYVNFQQCLREYTRLLLLLVLL